MKDLNLEFLNSVDESIPFLPFGVTTIEFTFDGNINSGYVRPLNSTLNNKKSKEFVGFAENNQDFLVVWGAGNHEGQYVSENSTDRLFMQMIHLQGNHAEATIKFKHTGVLGRTKTLKVQSPIPVELFRDVVRMITCEQGSEHKKMIFAGSLVPLYYSRWFPPEKISYVDSTDFPQIQINYKEDKTGIISPLEISIVTQGRHETICKIGGDLRYSRFHGEMFALVPESDIFVLRLWLYWIHKKYRKGVLGVSVEPSSTSAKKKLGLADRISGLEIPDIERFDLVIDAKKNKIIRYATDFHYQEYWRKPENAPIEAKIARDIVILVKTVRLYPLRKVQDSDYYNAIEAVKRSILEETKGEPEETSTVVASQKEPSEKKKMGVYPRAHVPYIDPSKIGGKDFISSDSRRGAKYR